MIKLSKTDEFFLNLKNIIFMQPECEPFIVTNDMPKQNAIEKDTAIANIINDLGLFRVPISTIKRGTFLKTLGPLIGSRLYKKLKDISIEIPELSYILLEMEGDGLEISDPNEISVFLSESGLNNFLSEAELSNLLSVFYEKTSVTPADVSIALRNY